MTSLVGAAILAVILTKLFGDPGDGIVGAVAVILIIALIFGWVPL